MRRLLIALMLMALLGACHRSAPRAEPTPQPDTLAKPAIQSPQA